MVCHRLACTSISTSLSSMPSDTAHYFIIFSTVNSITSRWPNVFASCQVMHADDLHILISYTHTHTHISLSSPHACNCSHVPKTPTILSGKSGRQPNSITWDPSFFHLTVCWSPLRVVNTFFSLLTHLDSTLILPSPVQRARSYYLFWKYYEVTTSSKCRNRHRSWLDGEATSNDIPACFIPEDLWGTAIVRYHVVTGR